MNIKYLSLALLLCIVGSYDFAFSAQREILVDLSEQERRLTSDALLQVIKDGDLPAQEEVSTVLKEKGITGLPKKTDARQTITNLQKLLKDPKITPAKSASYQTAIVALQRLVKDTRDTYLKRIDDVVAQGADPSMPYDQNKSMIGVVLSQQDIPALTRLLESKNIKINDNAAINHQTLLVYACTPKTQNEDAVSILLTKNADPNAKALTGQTPLDVTLSDRNAVIATTINILHTLLMNGANPTINRETNFKNFQALLSDVQEKIENTTFRDLATAQQSHTYQAAQMLFHALFLYGETSIGTNPTLHLADIYQYRRSLLELRTINPGFDPINQPFPYGKKDSNVRGKTPIEIAALKDDHYQCLRAMLNIDEKPNQPHVTVATARKALTKASHQNKSLLNSYIARFPEETPSLERIKIFVKDNQQSAAHDLHTGEQPADILKKLAERMARQRALLK
ncbi:MAG: hypothetical protein WCW33_06115 [Candidatus Babeliales bacterium]|jgi:ankyrin repeat protein